MYIVKGHNWHWPAPSPREMVTILLVAILVVYALVVLTFIHYHGSGVWHSIFSVTLFACPIVLFVIYTMLYGGVKPFSQVSGHRLYIYKYMCHATIIAVGFIVALSWAGIMAQE